jgi:hypothetical protein
MNARRRRLIGIVLCVAWIAVAGLYGLGRARAQTHRDVMFCYRMQAEAKTNPRCDAPHAVPTEPMCGFKFANCSEGSRIEPRALVSIAAVALLPPALCWIVAFAWTSANRRRVV